MSLLAAAIYVGHSLFESWVLSTCSPHLCGVSEDQLIAGSGFSSLVAPVRLSLAKTLLRLCVVADPELLWGQILKTLNANMPEEFYMWISNLKKSLMPLLERAMDLLQAGP